MGRITARTACIKPVFVNRIHTWSIVAIFLLIAVFIHATHTFSYAQKNFLWRVQSKGSTAYVLGSIHLLKKDVYPLSRTIENAFEKSDVLAVEANIDDISRLDVQKMLESAFYSGDDTLERHVSGKTLDMVKGESERLGLPAEFVYKQRPWFLGLTLESLALVQSGYDPEYGIDKYFLSKAAGKKRVIELESLDYQIDLLSGLNDAEQELFLLYTLKDLKVLVREVDNVVDAWKSGAVKRMESIIAKGSLDERRFSSINEKLIIRRNRNIVLKIDDYLKTKATYFVVVGAGHLLGEKGIIQLLKERGYTVEQL